MNLPSTLLLAQLRHLLDSPCLCFLGMLPTFAGFSHGVDQSGEGRSVPALLHLFELRGTSASTVSLKEHHIALSTRKRRSYRKSRFSGEAIARHPRAAARHRPPVPLLPERQIARPRPASGARRLASYPLSASQLLDPSAQDTARA